MKKTYSKIGMIFCAVIAILGLLVIFGVMGGKTSRATSASYLYDSGYASFGGDFQTYVSNNAQEAASASRTTASNLCEIALLMRWSFGLLLLAVGVIGFCGFGVIYNDGEEEITPRNKLADQKE